MKYVACENDAVDIALPPIGHTEFQNPESLLLLSIEYRLSQRHREISEDRRQILVRYKSLSMLLSGVSSLKRVWAFLY